MVGCHFFRITPDNLDSDIVLPISISESCSIAWGPSASINSFRKAKAALTAVCAWYFHGKVFDVGVENLERHRRSSWKLLSRERWKVEGTDTSFMIPFSPSKIGDGPVIPL